MGKPQKSYNDRLFLKKIEDVIVAHKMLKNNDAVLVGVSGGPDSVVLLHVLIHFIPRYSLQLAVAHLNHCLRGDDSDNDAEFVTSLAESLELPCFIGREDVRLFQKKNRLSLEEAGRHVRYEFLNSVAEKNGFTQIAVGHHLDDNAELILMNLFRGSGTRGISGIPPKRDGKICRPLIETKQSEISAFIKANNLAHVTDKTNQDISICRNRIRHQLIPDLKAFYNPRIIETLGRLTSILKSEEEWINGIIDDCFHRSVSKAEENTILLSIPDTQGIHPAAQRRLIRKIIQTLKGDLRRITLSHIDTIIHFLNARKIIWRIDLPDRIMVRQTDKNHIVFSREASSLRAVKISNNHTPLPFEYQVPTPTANPGTLFIPEISQCLTFSMTNRASMPDINQADSQVAFLNMDRLCFPLAVRNIKPGDRFTPLGMTGAQKLKKYFINNKVPRQQRAKCPILLSRNQIVWLGGHRIDEKFKVLPTTENIFKIELLLA
jgi:tRNA(Ile)-lysidine synthase